MKVVDLAISFFFLWSGPGKSASPLPKCVKVAAFGNNFLKEWMSNLKRVHTNGKRRSHRCS